MEDLNVNKNPRVYRTSRDTGASAALGFLLGAVVGAGIALLLAPGTGKETRRRLADVGARWGNAARSKLGQARDAANDLRQDAQSAVNAGRETFERAQKSHEPRPDSPAAQKV
jgi:gas vesicle protein